MKKSQLKEAIKTEIKSVLSENLKEVYQTNSKMSQIVSLFQDMMDDEYDGQDYRKVLNMVLKAIEDEMTDAEELEEKQYLAEDSLNDQAKRYFLQKVSRGEIDTLPENPKEEFLKQMMKDQMDHDEETLRRELNERMVYDIELEDVVYTPEGDEVKVVDIRDIGGSNEQAYTVEKTDGTRFELGDKSLELTGDKLKRDSEGIEGVSKYYSTKNEIAATGPGQTTTLADFEEEDDMVRVSQKDIKFHLDAFEKGNIEGEDLAQAIEDIVFRPTVPREMMREDEMTDAEKKKAAEKDAKKEKDFSNKQKEVDKLKKELADNKDELVKISKISGNERTKAQQNLLNDMAKKTKELKKLRRVEV